MAVRTAPESAEALTAAAEAIKLSGTHKEYHRLTMFLKHVILYSKSDLERAQAQKTLAMTYFNDLGDYTNAVIEINKAMQWRRPDIEKAELRLTLARAYFFQNRFFQARSEVDELLKETVDPDIKFKGILLKANVFFNEKKLDEAIEFYHKLQKDFPEQAKAEQVPLNLAVCYEEKEDFEKAIEILEEMRDGYSAPEMIDLKITRLKARQAQQPGAKGLKK